jgi:hypothetical protein
VAYLEVQFPDIVKERPNSVIVLRLVQQYEFHICPENEHCYKELTRRNILPGVMNADTVHSLNLSTDFRYLSINVRIHHQRGLQMLRIMIFTLT